jgi:hypothetical protein
VRLNGGDLVYSDNPGIVALAGKNTPFNDPATMTGLANAGRWDETGYREMLHQKRFSMLVLTCDAASAPTTCSPNIFTSGVLAAIQANYKTLFPDIYYTIVPK